MLHIEDLPAGRPVEPLEKLTVRGGENGSVISVTDAVGREYARRRAREKVQFAVGGAAGTHTLILEDADGEVVDLIQFEVEPRTKIVDQKGQFGDLLHMLHWTMLNFTESDSTRWNGRVYQFFVRWLRDHVHTLKGMKYFYPELKSAIDLYHDSQREDGMIWDNVHPRGPEPNMWDVRFSYDNFIRPFDDYTGEFKRIPVENDVEYLYIEGIYYTWKAVGDDGWMTDKLDSAIKALNYSMTSPYRWSEKHKLLKRGFTIDTWDFQAREDACISNDRCDPMVVEVDRTRFGVMHGDNTGYHAACRQLAEMLEYAGRSEEAAEFRQRGEQIKQRLDKLAWTGDYYLHHVPEDKRINRDLGVDQDKQVSLSNAYALNRGLDHEQAKAIIKTYQKIKANLPHGSPGEWYTIYPPFEQGFGGHNSKWQYMNGGVITIVAGELAHGAFEHGFEDYAVDILRRVYQLGRDHKYHLHCCFTGAFPKPPKRKFKAVNIAAQANCDFSGTSKQAEKQGVPRWTGEGENDLHEMPTGRKTFEGVRFNIPEPAKNGRRGCIMLSPNEGYMLEAEVPVDDTAASVYLLHTCANTPAGVAGRVVVEYADGTEHVHDVVQGRNVQGWWMPSDPSAGKATPRMKVGWRGKNKHCPNVGVVVHGFDHPHPRKKIAKLRLEGPKAGGFWAVCGVSLCDQPAYFPPSTVSSGIPDNWGAAAVVYALIEGLAGVVDEAVRYEAATIAPRWTAAGLNRAEVTVAYPGSRGYVAYTYRHNPAKKQIKLTLTGSGEAAQMHVLMPSNARRVKAVRVGREPVEFSTEKLEKSTYADFMIEDMVPTDVTIEYT